MVSVAPRTRQSRWRQSLWSRWNENLTLGDMLDALMKDLAIFTLKVAKPVVSMNRSTDAVRNSTHREAKHALPLGTYGQVEGGPAPRAVTDDQVERAGTGRVQWPEGGFGRWQGAMSMPSSVSGATCLPMGSLAFGCSARQLGWPPGHTRTAIGSRAHRMEKAAWKKWWWAATVTRVDSATVHGQRCGGSWQGRLGYFGCRRSDHTRRSRCLSQRRISRCWRQSRCTWQHKSGQV